jgi:hypothetical protein
MGAGNVRDTAQTKSRTPVGDLPDGNGVDTLVDTGETLTAVNVHESAETHGCVGLRQTTSHATNDAGAEVVGAEAPSVVLGF